MTATPDLDRLLRDHYRAAVDESVPAAQLSAVLEALPTIRRRHERRLTVGRLGRPWSSPRLVLVALLVPVVVAAALVAGAARPSPTPSPREYEGTFQTLQTFAPVEGKHMAIINGFSLPDGRVALVLNDGFHDADSPDSLYVADPSATDLAYLAPFPRGRYQSRLVPLGGGRVLVLDDGHFEVIDADSGASVAQARTGVGAGGQATALADGRVLLTGGMENGVAAELYDPTDDTVVQVGPMARTLMSHEGILLDDGRVLLTGGFEDGGKAASPTAQLFDPTSLSFTDLGTIDRSLVDGYSMSLVGLPDGRILVLGGWGWLETVPSPTPPGPAVAHLFDPGTNTFSPTGALPGNRMGFSAAPLQDGRVLVLGGAGTDMSEARQAFVFDPETGRFDPTGSLAAPRVGGFTLPMGDGRVIVAGGDCYPLRVCATALTPDPGRIVEVYE